MITEALKDGKTEGSWGRTFPLVVWVLVMVIAAMNTACCD